MKKSDLISLTALAILVVGLFVYAIREPGRMARAEERPAPAVRGGSGRAVRRLLCPVPRSGRGWYRTDASDQPPGAGGGR